MLIIWGRLYLPKRDRSREQKLCNFCGTFVQLESFEGFCWGHLYYVPLLPLGTHRVIDRCGQCSMQREIAKDVWDAEKKAALSVVAKHFDTDPSRLDYALEALGLMSVF